MATALASSSPFEMTVVPLRVVIVEDNLLIAMDLEMQIEAAGHEVVGTAMAEDEAVVLVRAQKPDIVLMDLRLAGGTSGESAAERLHRRDGVRCVFVSGNLDPETRERLASFDPVAMLSKPVQPQELLRTLDGFEAA